MRLTLAQINPTIADFEGNLKKIENCVSEALKQNSELVIFPELSLCGYPPLDFLEHPGFLDNCFNSIEKLKKLSLNIDLIIGAPSLNTGLTGKRLYNSAWVLSKGEVKEVVHKMLLPVYDVFDESRYFEPADKTALIDLRGHKIALTICEDLWDEQDDTYTPLNHPNLYRKKPMDWFEKENPELLINIAASPFSTVQQESRLRVLKRNARHLKVPLVYVNQCGAQTELLFDGQSMVLNATGEVCVHLPLFNESTYTFSTESLPEAEIISSTGETELIHQALITGIKDFFYKQGFKKATLGLSGGIDSALTLALAAEALGAENVFPVLLPSAFSSEHSIDDARKGAEILGCKWNIVPIENAFQVFLKELNPLFGETAAGLAEENIQARCRGVILMALSNKFGHILLNTSNKSELAVGYGTLYGDMCGGLSVIGDVYKTKVYELARYVNRNHEIIPQNCLIKEPSAELRPGQKDSDSLPPYPVLDAILFELIENKTGLNSVIEKGFDKETVFRVYKLLCQSEHKRKQAPPVIRISPKAFGLGRRMPIVAKYSSGL